MERRCGQKKFINFLYGCLTTRNISGIIHQLYLQLMFVDSDLQQRWWNLEAKLAERFEKKPDMEAILFLIGMQETGFIKQPGPHVEIGA